MSLRSPGSVAVKRLLAKGAVYALSTVIAGVFLYSPGFAQSGPSDRKSGVVAPKVAKVTSIRGSSDKPLIIEYPIPNKYSIPYGIAVDSKDKIWFTQMGGQSLAVLDPATDEIKEYRIPSTVGLGVEWEYDPRNRTTPEKTLNNYSVGKPGNMFIDKNDTVWFVMQLGNSIVRFDPVKEEFTEYMIPTPNAQPYDIAADESGRVWYIEKNGGKFGYLDFNLKKMFEIDVAKGAQFMGITLDSKGNVWIGEVMSNYLARYNPDTKNFKVFTITEPNSQPGVMRFDKNGVLWVCNLHAQQLGVLMTEEGGKSVYSVVDLPGYNAIPQGLAIGDDGKIWVVDSMMGEVSYFDPMSLRWNIFTIPTPNAQPMNVAIDSKGDVWFTESDRNANKIGRVVRNTVPEISEIIAKKKAAKEAKSTKTRDAAKAGKELKLYLVGAITFVILFLAFFVIRWFRR